MITAVKVGQSSDTLALGLDPATRDFIQAQLLDCENDSTISDSAAA